MWCSFDVSGKPLPEGAGESPLCRREELGTCTWPLPGCRWHIMGERPGRGPMVCTMRRWLVPGANCCRGATVRRLCGQSMDYTRPVGRHRNGKPWSGVCTC